MIITTNERFETRKNDLLEQKYEEKTLLRKGGNHITEKSVEFNKTFLQKRPRN